MRLCVWVCVCVVVCVVVCVWLCVCACVRTRACVYHVRTRGTCRRLMVLRALRPDCVGIGIGRLIDAALGEGFTLRPQV